MKTPQNEDRDRMLAEAWRDLAGCHVGMVERGGAWWKAEQEATYAS